MPFDRSNKDLSKIMSFHFFCGIHTAKSENNRVVVGHQPESRPFPSYSQTCSWYVAPGEFWDFPLSFQIWFGFWSQESRVCVSSVTCFSFWNLCWAEERARKEAAERERELLRQKQYEQQQQMEAQDRSLRENIAQLRRKLERERENFEKEQERLLEHRLKVSLAWPH